MAVQTGGERAGRVSAMRAAGLSVAAFTCWVFADTSLKLAGLSALPVFEIIAMLGMAMVLLLLAKAAWQRKVRALWPHRPGPQLLRSSLDLANNLGVIVALRHLPLALFYILVFLAPLTTTLLASRLIAEPLAWKRSVALVVGFAGVIIAVNPLGAHRAGDWTGVAACMVCVMCFSFSILLSRVTTQTETPDSLAFVSALVMLVAGVAVSLPALAVPSARIVAVLAAAGVFSVGGALCFFVAIRSSTAADVMQFHYSQLLSGAALAWLLFRERPTAAMLLGAPLIVGAGWYTARAAKRAVPAVGVEQSDTIPAVH